MKFEHLKYFVEIAHCSSINNAAKNLFVSQPTLTSAIKSLEKDLGFQLRKRSHQSTNASKPLRLRTWTQMVLWLKSEGGWHKNSSGHSKSCHRACFGR